MVFSSDPNEPPLVYSATYMSSISRSFLESITDPRNNTTYYTHDASGYLRKITFPEVMTDQGLQTPEINLTYGVLQVDTITSPDGIVIKYDYYSYNPSDPNLAGQIKTITLDYGTAPECMNIAYHFTYGVADPNLMLTGMRSVTVENPDGHLTTLIYDALDLLRLVEDSNGHLTRLDYNADRKLETVQRQFGSGWQEFEYGYTIMAKLQTITDSLGRTTELDYDERFLVGGITDAEHNTTEKRYNTRQLIKELINAENNKTAFEYNDNGQLRLIIDAEDSETEYI